MSRRNIITALDIGSGSIKILSVVPKTSEENFEILSFHQENAFGVRRGVVVDVPKVGETILSLVKKSEEENGHRISDICASIGGCHLYCTPSHGLVSVSRADRKISEEDVDRVLRNSQIFPLPSNKEIIEAFPRDFIVDGEKNIKEVVGLEGMRLEANVLALCGFSPYLKNSSQAIALANLQISDLMATPLASSRAVITPREKELGVAMIDIGAGTTSLAVFEEGNLIHAVIFPVGSGNITSDLAICFKVDPDIAEKIKLEFGECRSIPRRPKDEKKIKIEGEETFTFSKKALAEIIGARVSEIFELVNKELKKISKQGLLPAGIVLTGGGAKLAGIKELAKKELKLPVRIGFPKGFSSSLEDPSFSALCGLVLESAEAEEAKKSFSWFGLKDKLKKIIKSFVP